ncbi:hypothetical protein pb186bvf_002114 [Paramecium bursaria]
MMNVIIIDIFKEFFGEECNVNTEDVLQQISVQLDQQSTQTSNNIGQRFMPIIQFKLSFLDQFLIHENLNLCFFNNNHLQFQLKYISEEVQNLKQKKYII